MHTHRMHLPHLHARHPDLRHLARDAAIAAEVALASVVLTGSIELASHRRAEHSSVAPPTVAAAVSAVAADAAPAAASVTIVHDGLWPAGVVRIPAGGAVTLEVVDPSGAVVASAGPVTAPAHSFDLGSGSYRVVVSIVGPVETVGDTAIASSTVLRSELFQLASPGAFDVVLTRTS